MKLRDFLIFEVAGKKFGVDLASVEEVVPVNPITAIPNSPSFLLGLTAVRGRVMGVIDSARRYNIGTSLNQFFMICYVRGNITAVTIDRAVKAGAICVENVDAEQKSKVLKDLSVDPKFLKEAFEIVDEDEEKNKKRSGNFFFEIDADLFVSAEMANRIGEV